MIDYVCELESVGQPLVELFEAVKRDFAPPLNPSESLSAHTQAD
jgi:hypothetical protein